MARVEDVGTPSALWSLAPRLTPQGQGGRRQGDWTIPVACLVGLTLLWEWAAHSGMISPLLFPAPSTIGATLARLANSGELGSHLSATLYRVFAGLIGGGLPGLLLGLLMGWSRRWRAIVDPFIAATNPIPKIAVLPLLMVIFGIGETSIVVAVALSTFFPMLLNTMAGARQIHPIHFEVAQNYGASPLKIVTRVLVPGSLPMIVTGVRLAINVALLTTIAVELVAARSGLGAQIWLAWQTLRTELLYSALVVTALLGLGFNLALEGLARRLVPWQVER